MVLAVSLILVPSLVLLMNGFRTSLRFNMVSKRLANLRVREGTSNPPSLLHMTIKTAAEGLESGQFTSVDLTRAYLRRIEEASDFNAVLQINPDAISVARKLDEERRATKIRG